MRDFTPCRFYPWVGPDYDSAPTGGVRTLVLGESHYTGAWNHCVDADLTSWVMRDVIAGGHHGPFFRNIYNVMLGAEPAVELSPERFWNGVAFYNYVQDFCGAKSRVRPTEAAWATGREPLAHVLRELRPQFVLVCGAALWYRVREVPAYHEVLVYKPPRVRARRWTTNGDTTCVAGQINHPSSFGFRISDWTESVREYLGFVGEG